MTIKEKTRIKKWADTLTDEQLETEYYKAVNESLGSCCDDMYELGYDIIDIIEQQKWERYLSEKASYLEYLCTSRGIKLWEENTNNGD